MIVSFYVLTFWIISAMGFGVVEAWIWHFNSMNPMSRVDNYLLHGMFLIQRGILFFLSVMIVDKEYNGFPWPFALAIWFIFPFFHNGAMYMRRNEINPKTYLDGWCSDPHSTSMAKGNIPYNVRVVCLLSGVAIYITWLIL